MSHEEIIRLEESLKSLKCSIDNVGSNLLNVFSQIGKLEDRVRGLEIEITATKTNLQWVINLKKHIYVSGIVSSVTAVGGVLYGLYRIVEYISCLPH